jgi:hypothetical protein
MAFILLLLVVASAIGFRTSLAKAKTIEEIRMELVQKGKELYIQGKFPEAISILIDYFCWKKLNVEGVDLEEPYATEGVNLLADCWWSNGQYRQAISNYLYPLERTQNKYSEYIFTVLVKIIPPNYSLDRVEFPSFSLKTGPQKHTVLHAVGNMMHSVWEKEVIGHRFQLPSRLCLLREKMVQ